MDDAVEGPQQQQELPTRKKYATCLFLTGSFVYKKLDEACEGRKLSLPSEVYMCGDIQSGNFNAL